MVCKGTGVLKEGYRPSRTRAESGKQLEAKGGGWWGQTHLHGPHQSVCWLRPKRARHFLGEPGSAHSHARGAGQRASRQAAGQSRPQKEEVTSVSASHRCPVGPIGRGPCHGAASPIGRPGTQSQGIRKGGHLARRQTQWEEWGRWRKEGILSGWLLAGCSTGAVGEEPTEAHSDPASSALPPPPSPPPPVCLSHISLLL